MFIYFLFIFQFDPHFSLFNEFKFSDKKGFKKYYFEFSKYKLSYQKDTRVRLLSLSCTMIYEVHDRCHEKGLIVWKKMLRLLKIEEIAIFVLKKIV